MSVQETLLACQPEWNVGVEYIHDFELGCQAFKEIGFGDIEMVTSDVREDDNTVTISLMRRGEGQPAAYASFLAFQAGAAREDGHDDQEILEHLKETVAPLLLKDKKIQKQVMQHSLARTGSDLEAVIQSATLQAGLFGLTHPEQVRSLLESNLVDKFPGIKPE